MIYKTASVKDELKKIYPREWLLEAPLVLLVASIPGTNWVRSDGKNYGDVDAAIVMDHIILAATALGLATCWIGAFDNGLAKELLKLEKGLEPVALTPLGYSEAPVVTEQKRKSISELTVFSNF